ncbi:hypothetical protein ABVL1U2_120021 [Acinetobacter baumannii]|nr:hypothetical protein ABVL1U2_120021 [Acinetobacter baumannii]
MLTVVYRTQHYLKSLQITGLVRLFLTVHKQLTKPYYFLLKDHAKWSFFMSFNFGHFFVMSFD